MGYVWPMDLFRYFHPHHHPRLRRVPLRLQELGELELAAKELSRALKRAQIRSEDRFNHHAFKKSEISPEKLAEIISSLDFASNKLMALIHLHPGDSVNDMERLIEERKSISGWENWSRIVKERLNDSIMLKKAAG